MADAPLNPVLRRLNRWLDGPAGEPIDGELIDRFLAGREEAAFAELVRRHGPMVLGVCRRILSDPHDAEDAFQAAFLVLARGAGSIRDRRSVGSWLYGVALRVSRRARLQAARRRAREKGADPMPQPDPFDAVEWRDLRPVLDEELGRMPDKYRAPLVLCYLEGKSHEEAARHLGWPNGTVCGRLARARDMLRRRLERRGLACSASLLAVLVQQYASAAVPGRLAAAAVRVGCSPAAPPDPVARLADGGGPGPFRVNAQLTAGTMLLGAVGVGAALLVGAPPDP